MFDSDFEHKILKLTATDVNFATQFGQQIPEETFSSKPVKVLFSKLLETVIDSEKPVSRSECIILVDTYAEERSLEPVVVKTYKGLIKSIYRTVVTNQDLVTQSLVKFIKRSRVKDALLKSSDILMNDHNANYDLFPQLMEDAVSIDFGTDKGKTGEDIINMLPSYRNKYNPADLVKTGFGRLDEALQGGLAPGELICTIASPKSGKSTLGANIGANILSLGKNVFHITLEISEEEVMAKYACIASGLSYKELMTVPEAEYRARLEVFHQKREHLFIKHFTEGTVSTKAVQSWITKVAMESGNQPNVIVIDYDDCIVEGTEITMLNGTVMPVEDLVGLDEFWVYSCKPDGTIVPGRGHSARKIRPVEELIRVTLDNGKVIETSLCHKYMLRDGTYLEAEHLCEYDSLMPLYRKVVGGYEHIKDNKQNRLKPTHRMVGAHHPGLRQELRNLKKLDSCSGKGSISMHHKKFKFNKPELKLNNDPSNLQWMTTNDHRVLHNKSMPHDKEHSEYMKEINRTNANKQWADPAWRAKRSAEVKQQNVDGLKEIVSEAFTKAWADKDSKFNSMKKEACPHCNKIVKATFNKWRNHLQNCLKNPKKIARLERDKEVRPRECKHCKKILQLDTGYLLSHLRFCDKNPKNAKISEKCEWCKERVTDTPLKVNKHKRDCSKIYGPIDRAEVRPRECDICNESITGTHYQLQGHKQKCRKRQSDYNHKVVKVERVKLTEPAWLYDFTVDDYHNYALDAGVFTHNCLIPSKPTRGSSEEPDLYNSSGSIYNDLIQLAKHFNCPLVTFSQPVRSAWEKVDKGGLIYAGDIAHSGRKIHRASAISSLNFPFGSNYGVLYIDMARRGESQVKVWMARDLTRAKFWSITEEEYNKGKREEQEVTDARKSGTV